MLINRDYPPLACALSHSGVQLAEPAAVALHAGRVEELEAGRLRRRGLHHHLPRQVRRECLVFFGFLFFRSAVCCDIATLSTDDCLCRVAQVAHFYACEYYPAGNVIGQFPYVRFSCRVMLTRH